MASASTQNLTFKEKYSFEKRKEEAERVLKKYNDRVPMIIELDKSLRNIEGYKSKYLVPNDLTVGQLQYVVRKKIKLASEQALFLFIDNKLVPTNSLISEVYKEYHDSDLFLTATATTENSFGH